MPSNARSCAFGRPAVTAHTHHHAPTRHRRTPPHSAQVSHVRVGCTPRQRHSHAADPKSRVHTDDVRHGGGAPQAAAPRSVHGTWGTCTRAHTNPPGAPYRAMCTAVSRPWRTLETPARGRKQRSCWANAVKHAAACGGSHTTAGTLSWPPRYVHPSYDIKPQRSTAEYTVAVLCSAHGSHRRNSHGARRPGPRLIGIA